MRLLQIKDHPNYWVSTDGDVYKYKNGKYKKCNAYTDGGQLRVCIDGVYRYISRLVMQAFKPSTDKRKKKVYHVDGDKFNNKLTNLIWATDSEIQLFSSYTKEYRKKLLSDRARE